MSDDETAMLARARRGLAPTQGDAERVRLALEGTLLASAGAARTTSESPNLGNTPVSFARLGAALALAAATGAGGYALGFRAGATPSPRLAPSAVSLPPPASAEPVDTPAPPNPLPETPAPPSRPRPGTGEAMQVSTPLTTALSPPDESMLERETRLLARVERALRDDNPRLALGLLGELEREVPDGQLGEERRAARVIAHCKLGTESAPKLAADFMARHASSAYRNRIRAACDAAGAAPKRE